jgi:ABC-type branched-subunit amino acid transport system substrate-binding protein
LAAVLLSFALVVAACGGDDEGGGSDSTNGTTGGSSEEIDYVALGLWDDGPCDPARPPLKIGLMTIFQSALLSLEDQALALEAAAESFNSRGGANGACIEVTTCDDGGMVDQAVACVRTMEDAGVVATVNDQGTAGQAEVSAAMAQAGIPRVASNVVSQDWGDPNAYPLDASGTGVTFLQPQGLIEEDITEIGLVRVSLPAASALAGFLGQVYDGKATFPVDLPVPDGTTDFSQFILGPQDAGADGISVSLGEQEAVQVIRAGEQLNTDLRIGASLGSFPHSIVADFGEIADQMVFLSAFAPATADIPVYAALRDDLAASGEEALQTENLKTSPMRSWIGLYALLKMMRDAGMTEFTSEGITNMLRAAKDVPMLNMYGGENWTPNLDHPGIFKRAGIDRWATWNWDADAEATDGLEGNFVEGTEISFDAVLCGTPLGGPEPC